jgi:hypothetical protein
MAGDESPATDTVPDHSMSRVVAYLALTGTLRVGGALSTRLPRQAFRARHHQRPSTIRATPLLSLRASARVCADNFVILNWNV